MHEELKFLGLAPFFGILGALSTAGAWHLFSATLLGLVPAEFAVLSCLVAGLGGPVVVWIAVWIATRHRQNFAISAVRRSASVGLGLVVAVELGFYLPLGFFAIAFA